LLASFIFEKYKLVESDYNFYVLRAGTILDFEVIINDQVRKLKKVLNLFYFSSKIRGNHQVLEI
jgi:hypothetical protein